MAGVRREGVMTEADTCREFVTPRLIEAGWATEPHAIGEQRTFTDGRIMVSGGKVRRGSGLDGRGKPCQYLRPPVRFHWTTGGNDLIAIPAAACLGKPFCFTH